MSNYLNYWYNNGNEMEGIGTDLPPQAIPTSQKNDKWKKRVMDTLENIGLRQFRENTRFSDYYRMTRGQVSYQQLSEFIPQLRELEGLLDDFKIPTTIRHYDLLGIILNYLETVMMGNRDVFHPTNIDEIATNEREREQSRLMLNYFRQEFEKELDRGFLEKGVDRNRTEFASEEEQQEHQQQVAQVEQELTPQEINEYLSKTWKTVGVVWAEHTLKADRQRLRQDKKERRCINNFLRTGRMFMEYRVRDNTYDFKPWHPISTFFSQTVDVENVEEGEFVGRIHFYTPSDFVTAKAEFLSEDEKKKILNPKHQLNSGGAGEGSSFETAARSNFGTITGVPFADYHDYNFLLRLENEIGVPLATRTVYKKDGTEEQISDFLPRYGADMMSDARLFGTYLRDDLNLRPDMIVVTETYFRSWKRVGYLTYITETGMITSEVVTDDILDDFLKENKIKQIRNISLTELNKKVVENPNELVNTIVWDYVPEIWRGEKARTSTTALGKDLYYNIEPLEFQIRGEHNVFDVRLPVVGTVTDNPSDRILPFQNLYNIVMNQQVSLQEKELGAFFIFDIGFLPSDIKEYGDTETSLYNVMNIIKSTSLLGIDGSRQNVETGSVFNQFAVQDLSLGRQIKEKQEQAEYYKIKAFESIGLNPQVLFGEPVKYQTATGANMANQSTNSQTDYLYDIFNDFKSRCLETHLRVAQYIQGANAEITINYTKGDLSQVFLKLFDPQLSLRDIGIMAISDSESRKQLEQMKQYMLNQNTMDTDALELSAILETGSMQSLINIARMERERKELLKQQQHEREMEALDKQTELEKQKHYTEWQLKEVTNQRDRENDIRKAYILALGRSVDNNADIHKLKFLQEQQKIALKQEENSMAREDKVQELERNIEKEKEAYKLKEKELALKARQLDLKDKELDVKKYTSEINKN